MRRPSPAKGLTSSASAAGIYPKPPPRPEIFWRENHPAQFSPPPVFRGRAREGVLQTIIGTAIPLPQPSPGVPEEGEIGSPASGKFTAFTEDFSQLTQPRAADLIARIVAETGRIDVLVNNAGIIRRGPIVDHSEADWHAVLQVNLTAPFFLAQAAAKWWLTVGRDQSPADARLKIVNIASMLSFQGGIFVPGYTAAKHALAGITKAFANELAKEA